MKLFKKKKSDMKLPMMVNTNQLVADPVPIYKKPTHLTVMDNEQPTIIMPKPRRVITPTRKILTRFDNDKTQVEEQEYLDRSLLSLPTHEGNNIIMLLVRLVTIAFLLFDSKTHDFP